MDLTSYLPRQKVSERLKGDEWTKKCVDACDNIVQNYGSSRRTSNREKQINYDLLAGIFNKDDLKYVTNPLGLKDNNIPAELKHYDIVTPIFSLLIGEEAKRLFNFVVRTVNEDAISEKEKEKKAEILSFLKEKLISGGEETGTEEDFREFKRYLDYEYQDIRELTATRILNYLIKEQDTENKFLEGWEDALVAGEEVYEVDIINGEPKLNRCNVMELKFLLPHNSNYIDDSDIIVEDTYMSINSVLDNFDEDLTAEQKAKLEDYQTTGFDATGLNYSYPSNITIETIDNVQVLSYDADSSFDERCNIRVKKVTWKSKRKVGIVSYIDQRTGNEESIIVDEYYKPLPDEKVEWIWVSEFRRAYKLSDDIYINKGRVRVSRRHMDNPYDCKSPYIGTVYNANNTKGVSLMDRLKPYQYLYNVIFFRTELALAKSIGKVMEFDLAAIPTEYGFDLDKWAYYLQAMNISFKNSFEESEKGKHLGMISNASSTRTIDMEQGQYINRHIELLRFIEEKAGRVSGVTDQRMGQVQASELVGNVEKTIMQSSHITEKWFHVHNNIKKRVFEALIECGKEAWGGSSKKVQYVADDLSTTMLSIDGDIFENSEYGIFVSNSLKDNEAFRSIQALAHAGLQNDKLNFTQIMDILTTDSINSTRRKIELAEKEKSKSEQNRFDQEMQIKNAELERLDKVEQSRQELLERNNIRDNDTKLQVAELSNKDEDYDINIDALEENKLQHKISIDRENLEIEKETLRENIRKNKANEEIKRKTASKKPTKK